MKEARFSGSFSSRVPTRLSHPQRLRVPTAPAPRRRYPPVRCRTPTARPSSGARRPPRCLKTFILVHVRRRLFRSLNPLRVRGRETHRALARLHTHAGRPRRRSSRACALSCRSLSPVNTALFPALSDALSGYRSRCASISSPKQLWLTSTGKVFNRVFTCVSARIGLHISSLATRTKPSAT